ncbi:MAG TPA: DUF4158 domain-containing protein [Nonomuraea sp.]|nr:DUF4158 domain-containing protein [Nonomuraea sp.]
MPVDFLSDSEAAKYGRYDGSPSRAEMEKIAKAFGLKDIASAEAELAGKVRAHAWNTGDGPTALFQYAVRWLRQNDVLLPGITTLTRLVARERERATRELHDALVALFSAQQRAVLDLLLEVPPGRKVSDLERWRTGPSKASGPQIVKSLDLVAEIGGTELGRLELDAAVPQRRGRAAGNPASLAPDFVRNRGCPPLLSGLWRAGAEEIPR